MSTFAQIKQIHILKNILGLEDDLYRDILASFGVGTSKDLTITEAQILIEIFSEKLQYVKTNPTKKYDDFTGRDSDMATPPQLRKIEVLWEEIQTKKTRQKNLRQFLQTQFHVDDIRFMTKVKASRIIAVMEKIKLNQCLKAI